MDKPTILSRETDLGAQRAGFVLVTLIATILPLLVLVSAASATMSGRNDGLMHAIRYEKALMAAESGIDEALFRATNGTLLSGVPFNGVVSNGMTFTVSPLYLMSDAVDNDGDMAIDEPDENVFRLTITGSYRNATRKIVAYLGPVPLLPPIESALSVQNKNIKLELKNGSKITGNDINMNGTPGPSNLPGMTIAPPGNIGDLLSQLSPAEQAMVTGTGAAPSLAVASAPIDIPKLVLAVKNAATMTLASDEYKNFQFGNGPAGDFRIIYHEGELELKGNSQGAGILVVTGELEVKDTFRFDGIIIALGEVEFEKNITINGGLILGPKSSELELENNAVINYSSQVVDQINLLSPGGSFVQFNGWQEITRN